MKNLIAKISFPLLIIFALLLAGCDCIKGEGEIVSELRDVEGFDGISLNINAKLILKQDSVYNLMIEAQPNILEALKTEVRGNKLNISTKHLCISGGKGITIHLSMPELREVNVNGSGKVYCPRVFKMGNLDLEMNGSGEVEMEVKAENITFTINGSGEIEMRGTAKKHSIKIQGSGDVYAVDLRTGQASVDIYGSGHCKLYILESLDIFIGGSGNVYYKGSPEISIKVRGSGKVHKLD